MKKPLLILLAILSSCLMFSQLNKNANKLKTNRSERYQQIKTFVEQDWKGDHQMMVYNINAQADAFSEVYELMQSKGYDEEIMLKAFGKWGIGINGKRHYDYTMVVYQYKNEIKAKNQY